MATLLELDLSANARTVALQGLRARAGLRPSVPTKRLKLTAGESPKSLREYFSHLWQVSDQAASVQFPRAASLHFAVPGVWCQLGRNRSGLRPLRGVQRCNPRVPWSACKYRARMSGGLECGNRSSSFCRVGAAALLGRLVGVKSSPHRHLAARGQLRTRARGFKQRPNKTFELTSAGALRSPELAAQCWR